MSAPAAIRATFSDWRTVRTRRALQLIFEVPLEQQAAVLAILGAPLPEAETWCAIARLQNLSTAADTRHERALEPPDRGSDPESVPRDGGAEATLELSEEKNAGLSTTTTHRESENGRTGQPGEADGPSPGAPAPHKNLTRSLAGKVRYQNSNEMEKARQRAVLLCKDARFQH